MKKFNFSKPSKAGVILYLKKVAICTFSIFLLGLSTAICTKAGYGTNSIAVLFNGVAKVTGLRVGDAANILNTTLMIAAFIINRKYISTGTIIYAVAMGWFINWGIGFYNFLAIPHTLVWRSVMATFGCGLFFLALSMFVAISIGVNPWVAFSLIFRDKFKQPFGRMKMAIDLTALAIGWLLGGKVGVVTVVAAFACGPIVQRFSEFFEKVFNKLLKIGLEENTEPVPVPELESVPERESKPELV